MRAANREKTSATAVDDERDHGRSTDEPRPVSKSAHAGGVPDPDTEKAKPEFGAQNELDVDKCHRPTAADAAAARA